MSRVIRRIRENRPGLVPNSNFANNANFAGCSRSERGSQRRFWGESPVRWESRFSSPGCSRGTRNARENRPEPDPTSNFANNANYAGCFRSDRGVRKGQSGPAAEPETFAESARADFCEFCEFCEGVWRVRRLPEEARLTVARGERGVADLASKTRGQWMGESGITTSARVHRGRLLDLGMFVSYDYDVRVQAEQFHAGDPGIVPSPCIPLRKEGWKGEGIFQERWAGRSSRAPHRWSLVGPRAFRVAPTLATHPSDS